MAELIAALDIIKAARLATLDDSNSAGYGILCHISDRLSRELRDYLTGGK